MTILLFLAVLQGTVRDSQQHPLAAAKVQLQQEGAPAGLSTHTDEKGKYRFASISPGTYKLQVELAGYRVKTSDSLKLNEEQTKSFDLTLEPSFFDEPQYTVAGVTDNTYRGGHGSDTVLRSSEALTKAAASLGKASAAPSEDNLANLKQAAAAAPNDANIFHLLGAANEASGNPLEAVRAYQRAAELQPSEPNIFDLGSELLTHLAPDAAALAFTKGNQLFPTSIRMVLGLATALYAEGHYEESARSFFHASDIDPSDPQPYLLLGQVQRFEITQSPGFLERMKRFAQLHPENARAHYYYAIALWKKGESGEQLNTSLDKAIELDPHLAEGYLLLGILASDDKSAMTAYQRAIELDPNLEEPHYRLAQIYKKQGNAQREKTELALYDQISKQNAREIEHQRGEIQRFVLATRKPSH